MKAGWGLGLHCLRSRQTGCQNNSWAARRRCVAGPKSTTAFTAFPLCCGASRRRNPRTLTSFTNTAIDVNLDESENNRGQATMRRSAGEQPTGRGSIMSNGHAGFSLSTPNVFDGRVADHLGDAVSLKTLSIHVCICPNFGM